MPGKEKYFLQAIWISRSVEGNLCAVGMYIVVHCVRISKSPLKSTSESTFRSKQQIRESNPHLRTKTVDVSAYDETIDIRLREKSNAFHHLAVEAQTESTTVFSQPTTYIQESNIITTTW